MRVCTVYQGLFFGLFENQDILDDSLPPLCSGSSVAIDLQLLPQSTMALFQKTPFAITGD
jgi:hypothetical protein